jgi:hypothetical protein
MDTNMQNDLKAFLKDVAIGAKCGISMRGIAVDLLLKIKEMKVTDDETVFQYSVPNSGIVPVVCFLRKKEIIKINSFLENEGKIQAIKALRGFTHLGLKDAKEMIELHSIFTESLKKYDAKYVPAPPR